MSDADTSESDTECRAEQDLREVRRAESFFAVQLNSLKEAYRVQSSKLADDFLVQQAVLKAQHATSAELADKLADKLAALALSRCLAIKREESQPRKLQRVLSYVETSPLEAEQRCKLSRGQRSRKRKLLARLTAASGEEMDSLNFEGAVAGDDGAMDSLNVEGAVAGDDDAMIAEIFEGVLAVQSHPRPPSTLPPPWNTSTVTPKAQPKQHPRRVPPRPPKAPPTAPICDVVGERAQQQAAQTVDAWIDADTTW